MLTTLLRLALGYTLRPFHFTDQHTEQLSLDVAELGLYVHLPFCKTLCPFCPYYREKFLQEKVAPFTEALLTEIEAKSRFLNGGKKEVECLYFGGGSPLTLAPQLPEIIAALQKHYTIRDGIAVEVHPGELNTESVAHLRDCGVTKLSLGVQSFSVESLEKLGRKQTASQQLAFESVAKAGFDVIDVDLIFGIPGQTRETLREDFLLAVAHGATQISTYPYIDFSYANNRHRPLRARAKKKLLRTLLATAQEVGFERSSVWTFSRPGSGRYSSVTRDNFIGFGPSAATLLPDQFHVNTFSVDAYNAASADPRSLTLQFTPRMRQLYWLFWSSYNLRLDGGDFRNYFSQELIGQFGWQLRAARLLRLLQKKDDHYVLTDRGAYYFHLAEQVYTHQYIDKMWQQAMQTPWPKEVLLY